MRIRFNFFLIWILTFLPLTAFAKDVGSRPILPIVDFGAADLTENTGVWVHNILDPDQSLKIEAQEVGQKKVLKLDYDVDSPNPAMVGFWVNLRNQDLREFDTLYVSLKADGEESFLGNIALQFTDVNNRKAAYLISRIPSKWKEFQVPLKKFNRINDWSEIKEFEIIIDDINARPKEGVLLVKEIYASKDHGK